MNFRYYEPIMQKFSEHTRTSLYIRYATIQGYNFEYARVNLFLRFYSGGLGFLIDLIDSYANFFLSQI